MKRALLAALSLLGTAATPPPANPTPVVSSASAKVPMPARARPGINLSGCEFYLPGGLCPTVTDLAWYNDQGFTAVRIPMRSSQLDAVIPRLQPVVAEALRRGMLVVVDLHDFAPLDVSVRVPLIQRLAAAFGPDVWIDYDNEPASPTGTVGDNWVASAQAVNKIIAGARAAGVTNVLVAEWPGYAGNHRFVPTGKEQKACSSFACGLDRSGGLIDPLGRTVLGPHRYYDYDKSGTHSGCVPTGWYWSGYLTEAEKRGYKSLIGETAFGSYRGIPASCASAAKAIMGEINGSSSIAAFMVWGAGKSWNAPYLFRVEPSGTARSATRSDYVKLLTGKP